MLKTCLLPLSIIPTPHTTRRTPNIDIFAVGFPDDQPSARWLTPSLLHVSYLRNACSYCWTMCLICETRCNDGKLVDILINLTIIINKLEIFQFEKKTD